MLRHQLHPPIEQLQHYQKQQQDQGTAIARMKYMMLEGRRAESHRDIVMAQ
jgi:hypothetical protein